MSVRKNGREKLVSTFDGCGKLNYFRISEVIYPVTPSFLIVP